MGFPAIRPGQRGQVDTGSNLIADPDLQMLNKTTGRSLVKGVRDIYKTEKTAESGWLRVAKAVVMIAAVLVMIFGGPIGIAAGASVLGLIALYEGYKGFKSITAEKAFNKVFENASIFDMSEKIKAQQDQLQAPPAPQQQRQVAYGRQQAAPFVPRPVAHQPQGALPNGNNW